MQFHRQHVSTVLLDVVGRQLDATRHQVAELAELPQCFGQTRTETINMGTTLSGRHKIHVRLANQLSVSGKPDNSPVDFFTLTGNAARKRLFRNSFSTV